MNTLAQVAGFVMVVAFMFCYVPQIIKIFKNKSSKDVSLGLIVMSIIGYISGMIYMFTTTFGLFWFLNYLVGLIMCIILIYAYKKFEKSVD
jgi:uncharacterized protein with PQ loop repeat